ncbi:hypothetical protein CSA56_09875 [candidate division KSB3 bacterium]|uniref:DUF5666 domain-containing protein n=1 Tax=candidate division KSB3 bacterium TaxID=2044937 RepID=A0A2G6KDS4_9BACT|nr:MAG: hypothetical protein CSA56_09875 [candidate division KSB3 bacterium]
MKKYGLCVFVIMACLWIVSFAWADTLEMKDGRLLEGVYKGGTQHSIRFQVDGNISVFPKTDALAITFSDFNASPSQRTMQPISKAPTPAPKPKMPEMARGQITLESGTKIPVRLLDSIYLEGSKKGGWFKGMLESDLTVNGTTIAPKGTRVNGQIVTAEDSRSGATLAITLREMILRDQVIPLVTNNYMVQEETAKNVFDLGISTLKIVRRDREVNIPYRSLVEFETAEPVYFRRSR